MWLCLLQVYVRSASWRQRRCLRADPTTLEETIRTVSTEALHCRCMYSTAAVRTAAAAVVLVLERKGNGVHWWLGSVL